MSEHEEVPDNAQGQDLRDLETGAARDAAPAGRVLKPIPALPPLPTSGPSLLEQEHAEALRAAATPLSCHFELVGCSFASMEPVPDKAVPIYRFHPPCPFGKTVPDQDCRDCSHVVIHRYGTQHGTHIATHRYMRSGMTLPMSEATADKVMDLLEAEGSTPLRRPLWQAYFEAQLKAAQEQAAREAHSRDMEQRQRGPHGQVS